jgi:predicted ATP-grasp superfamily ATP-dependent carboligase
MKHILIYPCASGVGQEIYFALKNHKDMKVYGANSGEYNPGYFLFRENYIGNGPAMKNEKECIEWLRTIIQEKHIDILFPAYDDAQVWLKQREEQLGCIVATSSIETVEICRSKKKTYERLQSYIRCPLVYTNKPVEYPVFIKPECGEGSKGCFKIDSTDELDKHFTPDHMCIEYLPGEEYTVDCFSDKEYEIKFVGARERVMTRAGISIITKGIEMIVEIEEMARKISKELQCVGVWFFQIKRAKGGEMCLMEVAPRIPGAMAFHREQGINFAALTVYLHMNEQISIVEPRLTKDSLCCKIYNNYFLFPHLQTIKALYVDLDDTLLVNSKVNTDILSILYTSRNKNIPVYLVSRHKYNIEETLKKMCISKDIFSKIYHLDSKTPKSSVIEERPALFIDDSFRERREVSKKYDNVYCYDVDCVSAIRDSL